MYMHIEEKQNNILIMFQQLMHVTSPCELSAQIYKHMRISHSRAQQAGEFYA